MDQLNNHLANIRTPNSRDKVYKDECVLSFDNPETETGIYISLTSFLGFGKDYVEKYFEKTGHAVFLHYQRDKTIIEVSSPPQGDGPEKKITRLAIGVEGGFAPESNKKIEYTHKYEIVILPNFVTLPWPNPSLPEIVRTAVTGVIEAQSASAMAEMEALSGTWDGEARIISKHSRNLPQLDNGRHIPPSGWQCEDCDKTENLWLNLTDGAILCGRRFHDGSGGNNHALLHYQKTGFPLAVKLGTITKEGKADVFSYSEDDMVEDPKLNEHLAHWGINIANMEKTEKSMVELELDLNQKMGEWGMLQENSKELKKVFGPGLTGMVNLGNSCYLNSVMQVLFVIPDFVKRFVDKAQQTFQGCSTPAEDFNVQMAKLGVGLLSGKYSLPNADNEQTGISPLMFKTLIGRGHPDFSTKHQQDAQEFFLHMLSQLEKHSRGVQNPSDCFKYKVEERVQCSASSKVKYTYRPDTLLALNIPLEAAINKDEVSAYEAKKADAESRGVRFEPADIVRPRIKLFSCLEAFTQSEIVEQFYSTALGAKTTARKTTRLSTFPDYLLIQLKKFTLREDWVPIKLDVAVEMPDLLDLSPLKGSGPQPGEEELPELVGGPPPAPAIDEAVMLQMMEMGFPAEACKRAIFFTHNSGLEAATAWVMEHISDSDLSSPFVPPGTETSGSGTFVPDADALPMIMSMGFTRDQAVKALKATDNNVERAVDWIFSHQTEIDGSSEAAATAAAPAEPEYRDGDSRYQLRAFISHMGTSTMVGHYVCHILKDGQWVIFNDNKVALSENPPKDLGYLYLYERI